MRRHTSAVALLAITMLTTAVAPTGVAARERPDAPPASSNHEEPIVEATRGGSDRLLVQDRTTPVAPGVDHREQQLLDARGWLDVDVLDVDLADPASGVDLLTAPTVASTSPLSDQAAAAGAVAGVNGDFFDINATGAAIGGEVRDGQLRKGPAPGRGERDDHAGITADGLGAVADLVLEGTVTIPAVGTLELDGLNQHRVVEDGLAAFTPVWGSDASRAGVVDGATTVTEVVVADGAVTAVSPSVTTTPIPDDGFVLVGRGTAAGVLDGLTAGGEVELAFAPRSDVDYVTAVGGGPVLVRDGIVPPGLDDTILAPRTAVAFDQDRDRMWLMVVDGRQGDSRGMSLAELGRYLVDLGADVAMNLDGGGSSTMVARAPGTATARVANDPSDGTERAVPNGLGLFSGQGSGTATDIVVAPAPAGADRDRVFPGLTRPLRALAHDETYAPATAAPRWEVTPAAVADVRDDGTLAGRRTGTAEVTARDGDVVGRLPVQVLGPLDRLAVEPGSVALDGAGATTAVTVVGFDADGWRAPIEPADLQLAFDDGVVSVTPDGHGGLRIEALVDSGATLVEATAGDHQVVLPVTVGLSTEVVEDFDGCEGTCGWSVFQIGAPGSTLTRADGRTGGGLRLDHDFTGDRSTRAAYAFTPGTSLPLPGQPQKLTVAVDGDGNGAWLRAQVVDATGTRYTVNLTGHEPGVDWIGWRDVSATIPNGVQFPLALRYVYPVETNGDERYVGSIGIDDVRVELPQTLDVPAAGRPADRLWARDDELDDRRWSFAVLNDAQFTAADADSSLVAEARRALREVVASDAEFLVINGDFVDTSYPADFDLARRILDEEVGDALPVHYQPGNHEVLGTDRIDEFVDEFGTTRRTFDHRGVRFVLLNSAFGSLRASDFGQLVELRRALDTAADDPAVDQVVVMAHHPTNDPLPTDNSQLADRLEVAMLEGWFTEFETTSGKDVAYLGAHAGVFSADLVDGVEYVITGNTAKDPAGPPALGGFTGWTLFGIDPTVPGAPDEVATRSQGRPSDALWLQADTNPLLDAIEAPESVRVGVGDDTTLHAAGVQPDGRRIPLEAPVSTGWDGHDVHVGVAEDAPPTAVATFDPATGTLTGLRGGTGSLRVSAGTASTTVTIHVP